MSQPLDLLVDGGIFLDEQILAGNIRFGLVVIVVTHKKLDRSAGEEIAEFSGKLCGQHFVWRDDQCGALDVLDDFRNGVRFAGARCTQQCLEPVAVLEPRDEIGDGFGLVAFGCEFRFDFQHEFLRFSRKTFGSSSLER